MIKILKKCVVKVFNFVKKIMKSANFFFVLNCKKRRCSQIKPQLKVEIEVKA